MTRKHFRAIADTIKDLDLPTETLRKVIAQRFAATLRRESGNPHFDIDRFVTACLREVTE